MFENRFYINRLCTCSKTGSIHKPVISTAGWKPYMWQPLFCFINIYMDWQILWRHWWLIWPNSNGYLYGAGGHSCIWQPKDNQNLMKFVPIFRQASDIYEQWPELSTYTTLKLNFSMVFYPSLFYLGVKNLFSLLSFLLHSFAHLQDQLSANLNLQCW